MATATTERAGAYELGELLGAGGFGEVFRAKHPVIGREVAVKVLHAKYSKDPEAVARFVAEARAVNTIKHPGIVEIFDFGELPDGRAYCVMELIEGKTLRDVLRERTRLPIEEALPILRGIAEAIDAAHAGGIAHRDLKPDNVFVLADGGVKVIDFGLAKLTHDTTPAITETGAVFGTPLYMSPEQCRGKAVTTATDAYSFGVLAYCVLVGTPPFTGEALDLALHHLNDAPPPAKLGERVDRVLVALMAKDPAQRPPSLGEAVAAIAGDAALPPKPRTPIRARWIAGGMGALALAGTAAFALRPHAPPDDCTPPDDRLAGVWDPAVRGRVAARFAGAKRSDVDAAWRVLSQELDGWTAGWSRQWTAACHSPDRTTDALLYAQRMTCLENGLVSLRGITASVEDSDPALFSEGYIGSSLLPVLADCESTTVLRAQAPAPPPDQRDEVAHLVAETERSRIDLRTAFNARRTSLIEAGFVRARAAAKRLDELGAPQSVQAWVWLAHHLIASAREARGTDVSALGEAAKAVDTAIELSVRLRNDQWAPIAYQKQVMLLSTRGAPAADVDAAMERWRAAIERAGRPLRTQCDFAQMQVNLALERGKSDDATKALSTMDAACKPLEQPVLYERILRELREDHAMRDGRSADAAQIAREMLADSLATWGPDHRRTIVVRDLLRQALSAQGKAADARDELRRMIDDDLRVHAAPDELRYAWTQMIDVAHAAHDHSSVAEAFAEATKVAPDQTWVPEVAEQAMARGDLELAADVLDQARLDHAPAATRGRTDDLRAYLAFMRGDYEGAVEPARRAIAAGGEESQRSIVWLAVADAKAGRTAQALAVVPFHVAPYTARTPQLAAIYEASRVGSDATIYWALGRWRDAIAAYKKGLEIVRPSAPNDWNTSEPEAFLGDALVAAGDPKAAIEPLEDSLRITAKCCNGFHYYAPIAEFALARALVATGGERARAKQLAEAARDHFARLGPHRDADRAAVEAFLAKL